MSERKQVDRKHDKHDQQRFHHDMHHFHIDKRQETLRVAQEPHGVQLAIAAGDHDQALVHLSQDEAASLGRWLIAQGEAAKQIVKDGA